MHIKQLLNSMSYEELMQLRYDIANDAAYLQRLVDTTILHIETTNRCTCASCGSHVDESAYTLVFGPVDFRQKATFCSMDCLRLFTTQLQQIHLSTS